VEYVTNARKSGKNAFDATNEIVASIFNGYALDAEIDETAADVIGKFHRALLKKILENKISYEKDQL
jgi:hypothetical protein